MSRMRLAASESAPDSHDSSFWNRRIVAGSNFDIPRAEPSQHTLPATIPLDTQRAELSRQHVRALNTQFASWVQTQLKNHPDELWEDGVQDYITHASSILEKFSDIVNWLKAKTPKGEILSGVGSHNGEEKMVPEKKDDVSDPSQNKLSSIPVGFTSGFSTSWTPGVWNNSRSTKLVPESKESTTNLSQDKVNSTATATSPSFPAPWSSGLFNNSQSTIGSFNPEKKVLESKSSETKSFPEKPVFPTFGAVPSTSFSSPWSSGLFSGSQTPVFSGIQTAAPPKPDASEDGDEEPEQPSSPSVKKSEEKGITIVHEVKCKIYLKSSDPTDKDAWKDKGVGKLCIRCIEGESKGSKESKPTILVRNDVGKIMLNALLYPGIKTNLQKKSIVAIFHSADDVSEKVVAQTYLIRTKSDEDRDKLAITIQEYAPSS